MVALRFKQVIRELEVSVPAPDLWGRKSSWRLNQTMAKDLVKHDDVMQPP